MYPSHKGAGCSILSKNSLQECTAKVKAVAKAFAHVHMLLVRAVHVRIPLPSFEGCWADEDSKLCDVCSSPAFLEASGLSIVLGWSLVGFEIETSP